MTDYELDQKWENSRWFRWLRRLVWSSVPLALLIIWASQGAFQFFTFFAVLLAPVGGVSLLWGIGSGMMNGVRYSSLGACLAITSVSWGLSWCSMEIATLIGAQ